MIEYILGWKKGFIDVRGGVKGGASKTLAKKMKH